MIKVTASHIEYDIDSDDMEYIDNVASELPPLPTDIEAIFDVSGYYDEDEIEQFMSDAISEMTGFCHNGFTLSIETVTLH